MPGLSTSNRSHVILVAIADIIILLSCVGYLLYFSYRNDAWIASALHLAVIAIAGLICYAGMRELYRPHFGSEKAYWSGFATWIILMWINFHFSIANGAGFAIAISLLHAYSLVFIFAGLMRLEKDEQKQSNTTIK